MDVLLAVGLVKLLHGRLVEHVRSARRGGWSSDDVGDLRKSCEGRESTASVRTEKEAERDKETRTSILGLPLRLDLFKKTLLLPEELQQLLLVHLLGSLDLSDSTLRDLLELLLVGVLDVLELVVQSVLGEVGGFSSRLSRGGKRREDQLALSCRGGRECD